MPFMQTEKRRIRAVVVVSLALMLVPKVKSETQRTEADGETEKPVVILTIDYGDGAQKRFPSIPWKKGMTALGTLQWAAKHPRGIEFSAHGKDATTLISKIDDLRNQGGNKKNWIFRVNDKLADRSCGVFPVRQGDRILWKFEQYK